MKIVWKKGLAALCAATMLMTAPGMCVLADETNQEELIVSEAEQIPEEAWAVEDLEEKTIEENVESLDEEPALESALTAEPAELPEDASSDASSSSEEPADTTEEDSSEELVDTLDSGTEELVGAAVTRDTATAFMDKCLHKQVSSSRGNQCVELYNQYLEQVFGVNPYLVTYAYQIYDQSFPSGWTKIPAGSIKEYKIGDIVVYNAGNGVDVGSAGHVSLVYSVSNGKVKLIEQNWAGKKTSELYDLHTARLKGIIRPKFDKIFYVTYNANGGSGSMAKQTFVYGTGGNLRKNTFTRSGYTFVGWNLYKHSDKKWYYTNGTKTGWYAKGKQPSGYYLEVYKDQVKVAWTTDVDKDTIEMYAVWKENQSVSYGEWTTTKPQVSGNTTIQEKTQYRYATRELTWQETGSGTIDYAVKWTSGFNKNHALYTKYNKTPKTASETSTEKVTVSTSKIGYIYYHWCMGQELGHTYNRTIESNKTTSHQTFHAFFSSSDLALDKSANARKLDDYSKCKDTYWWLDERITINRCSYTTYKKSAYTGWSSWSSWQDNAVSPSDTVKVETRKLYRTVTSTTPQIILCSDVQNPSHPYFNAINWALNDGIAKGYSDGTFGTDRNCTRGEMMMFLWRYAGKPAPATTSKSPFPDVPTNHAFYKAILWGSQKGITKGYADGTFGINRNVSRGESMMFLWRLKGKPAPQATSTSPFKDVPTNHAFYKAILWGSQKGVTTGYTSGVKKGTFGIKDNCTRGQIVTFLYRAREIANAL